jgi:hypothetical protein
MPNLAGLVRSIQSLRTDDGGYTNEHDIPFASTPATAAAITILSEFGVAIGPAATQWLLDCRHSVGGFIAMKGAPIPDLLSTATALHALACACAPLDDEARAACTEFVAALAMDDGGFRGHFADDAADCEYTFYALLALGHLASGHDTDRGQEP